VELYLQYRLLYTTPRNSYNKFVILIPIEYSEIRMYIGGRDESKKTCLRLHAPLARQASTQTDKIMYESFSERKGLDNAV